MIPTLWGGGGGGGKFPLPYEPGYKPARYIVRVHFQCFIYTES